MSDALATPVAQPQEVAAITDNAIVLSNIIELGTSVVRQMSKEAASQALGEQSQTRAVVANTISNRIRAKLGL